MQKNEFFIYKKSSLASHLFSTFEYLKSKEKAYKKITKKLSLEDISKEFLNTCFKKRAKQQKNGLIVIKLVLIGFFY